MFDFKTVTVCFVPLQSFQKTLQLDANHFSANLNLGVIFHLEVRKYELLCSAGNVVRARRIRSQ